MSESTWEWADAEIAQCVRDGKDWVVRLSAAAVQGAGSAPTRWLPLQVRVREGQFDLPEGPARLLGRVRSGRVRCQEGRLSRLPLPWESLGPVVLELDIALEPDAIVLRGQSLQVRALDGEGVDTYQC